jgi:hypothetical protein
MYKIFFIIFFIAFSLSGCVKDVDFSQTDDFQLIQPIDIPFVYFDFNQTHFIDAQNNEIQSLTDETFIKIGSDVWTHISDKVELEINTSNSFDRDFTLKFDFYDINNVFLFQKSIAVSANSHNTTQYILIEGEELYLFQLMYKVGTKVIMSTGAPIQSNVNQTLSLKSALHFNLNYTSN